MNLHFQRFIDIKDKKYRQYIVTNGAAKAQDKKMKMTGFDKVMDGIFVSEIIGYIKPDVRFFEECFKKIPDFDIKKAIIIGDSLTSDMAGGRNAGVTTCWYNPEKIANSSDVFVDYEISNLQELFSIL